MKLAFYVAVVAIVGLAVGKDGATAFGITALMILAICRMSLVPTRSRILLCSRAAGVVMLLDEVTSAAKLGVVTRYA